MKPIKTIVIITAAVTFALLSSCRHHKKYHGNTSQQQVFPERTIGSSAQQDYSESEPSADSTSTEEAPDSALISKKETKETKQESLTLNDAHEPKHAINDAKKLNNNVAIKKRHKLLSEGSNPLAEEEKAQENEESEYNKDYNALLATNNNEERNDYQLEEQQQEVYGASVPQAIVRQRPVTPRGKFRKFDPRDL